MNLEYVDEEAGSKMVPHVIEPTFGVDRAVLAVLLSAYNEEDIERPFLKLKPSIAPVICAVSPLLKNKPELVEYANVKVFAPLKAEFGRVAWDDNGNIGKRYRRQDEIGTPFCVVDRLRHINRMRLLLSVIVIQAKQERIKVSELVISYIKE
jgi:glycyl-tRNA synthetase